MATFNSDIASGEFRVCRRCKAEKPIDSFGLYLKGKDGRQYKCKECANELGRKNYRENAGRYKDGAHARTADLRGRLNEAKSKPCTDCGNLYPPYVMDFDHLDASQKVTNVAAMMRRHFSWEKIQAEIEKCELVCSNCHRIRTHARNVARGIPEEDS